MKEKFAIVTLNLEVKTYVVEVSSFADFVTYVNLFNST